MAKKLRPPDPIGAHVRKQTAARRLGKNKQCECGESRPQALISEGTSTICARCQRVKERKSTSDDHHYAGRANDSSTIPVPVNDHRAELSEAQYSWPRETLENRDRNPFLAGAAKIRGTVDMIQYLTQKLIAVAEFLEAAHKVFKGLELKQFEPDQ